MAAVWAAGPEPMMATLVCGGVIFGLEVDVEKEEEWEAGRKGAFEKGFLGAVVGYGFCWKVEVAARERVRLERRGVRRGRRKVEENSLAGPLEAMVVEMAAKTVGFEMPYIKGS